MMARWARGRTLSYRFFVPSRGMHFRTRTTPVVVIWAPGHFLDLAGGAGSVIDQDALPEPQSDDVLLARDLLGQRRRCEHQQRETGEQRN